MSEESEREEIKDETHHIQDEEQEEFLFLKLEEPIAQLYGALKKSKRNPQ